MYILTQFLYVIGEENMKLNKFPWCKSLLMFYSCHFSGGDKCKGTGYDILNDGGCFSVGIVPPVNPLCSPDS